MTDTTLPPGDEAGDRIEPVDIQQEMQRSYIDYAMSVIVGRALPEVRDGLKPVHRRVLYAMFDSGFRPDRSHAKSARSVAETMGNYHPHGDSSIYDTLVRMAQPWSLRYPLVDGQGNFGSPGNDPPAAMRYTEARLTPLAMEMLREIDEETVDFIPNYDGRVQEPTVLPSRFPNLLANGSGGIAVGMATNMPPHNLRELAEAVYWCLDNHDADEEATLAAVTERRQGPGLPHSGLIVGSQGIHDTYTTGRGSIRMRGVVEIEEDSRGRTGIVITELPYQVNHDNFITSIAEQVRDGKTGRHLEHRGPVQRPCRAAHRRRDQARRRGEGGAEQPLQAHAAADQLRCQHAVDRRRRAAHPAAGPADPALRRPSDSTSSSGAPPTGCARPTNGPTSCAVWSRRSTRSTR